MGFLDSLNEIDATQLNEEKTDLRDRSSTVSIASNRSSTLDLDSFATNPMMSSAKDVDQPNVKASKWSKEADVYAEQLKEKNIAVISLGVIVNGEAVGKKSMRSRYSLIDAVGKLLRVFMYD